MTDNQETSADIIAEMRRRIAVKMSDAWYTQEEWRKLCDRLEAVLQRECRNNAKMREALTLVHDKLLLWNYTDEDTAKMSVALIDKCDKALAAPMRNCDKYVSLDEARNAYMAINEMPEGNRDEDMRRWLCDFHNWLFDPATEGGSDAD